MKNARKMRKQLTFGLFACNRTKLQVILEAHKKSHLPEKDPFNVHYIFSISFIYPKVSVEL
jgi:hypothetical protein